MAIDMGAGANYVQLQDITASKFLTVSGGADDDIMRLFNVASVGEPDKAAVRLRGLAGDDDVRVTELDAPQQRLIVTLNAGHDVFEAGTAAVSEVRFFGGNGPTAAAFNDVVSTGNVLLDTRNEADAVGFGNYFGRNLVGGDLTIATRNGDDSVAVNATTVVGQTRIITGRDDDLVALGRNEYGDANVFSQDVRVFNDHGRMEVFSVGRHRVDGVLRLKAAPQPLNSPPERFLTDSLFEGQGGKVINGVDVRYEQPFEDAFAQGRYAALSQEYADLQTLLDSFVPMDLLVPDDGVFRDASDAATPADAAGQFLFDTYTQAAPSVVYGALAAGSDVVDSYFYDFAPDESDSGRVRFGMNNLSDASIRLTLLDEDGGTVDETVVSSGGTGVLTATLGQVGDFVTAVITYLGGETESQDAYELAAWRL